MSLPYSFDFPGQLKNWLRVQGVAPKLYYFGQQILLCSSRFQPQDCLSLQNLLLLDATGPSAVLPSTRQGMHPSVALEKSTLRRMSLIQYSSCCRVSPKQSASPDFLLQSDSMLVAIQEGILTCCWSRLGHNSFFCILFAIVEQLVKLKFLVQQVELKWLILNKLRRLFHSSRVQLPLVKMSAIWCLVSM